MRRIVSFFGLIALVLGLAGVNALPAHAGAPPYGTQKWALIVGIDDYNGRTKKNVGSAGDAQDVYNLLIQKGWASDHIRLLTNKAATQQAMRDGMKWLVDNSSSSSYSVFHYSGHVKQITDKKDRDKDGEQTDEFLWPVDNKFIMDNELRSYMNALRGWAWIDISGCEGAGLNDGIGNPTHLFTASSQESEKSYEEKNWHNSVFTGFMVDQGMLNKQADANGDGRVTLNEGFNYAASAAPAYTSKQKTGPQHPYMAGGDGQEWQLDPPPPPPPPPPPKQKTCVAGRFLCH